VNLTGDQSQNYLVDAMTDELTTSLARTSGLRITSETSATQYRGTTKPLPQIAAELGVDAIVEGSVTRSANEIRVTAQLIDAKTDRHLWAQSYEREASDLLRLQRELSLDIASQVSARIANPGGTRQGTGTTHPEAFEAYARGRSHVEKWTLEGSGEGLKYFQRAIEIDPGFALAYVGEAECYRFGVPGVARQDSFNLAMDASERALALQPDMGEAHAAVGYMLMLRDWKFPEAEAELKRGIALNPNYAPAHHWYSHLLMNLGRFDESFQESQKVLELDPVSPAANLHLGNHYLASRQWDLAIEQEKKTLKMDPDYVEAHRQLAEAYLGKKMYQEAETEMQRAADLLGPKRDYPLYPALLGNILGQAGDIPRAQKVLSEIKSSNQPLLESYLYAGLGNRKRSIEMLNEAYHRRTISLELRFAPEFDPIRSDPGFEELMHKLGLL
jgi:TolB-like protein/Tfp pilus assembly protein PilF